MDWNHNIYLLNNELALSFFLLKGKNNPTINMNSGNQLGNT